MYEHIGIWAKTLQQFRNHSNKFGLPINEDVWQETGEVVPDGSWQLAGPFQLVKTPAVLDGNGDVVTPAVLYDGYFWNARVYGSMLTDIRGQNPQFEPDGETPKPFLDRTEVGKVTGGQISEKAQGTDGDNPKRPRRMSVGGGAGVQFEIFEGPMGPRTEIATPYNVWA